MHEASAGSTNCTTASGGRLWNCISDRRQCIRAGNCLQIAELSSNVEVYGNRLWECYDAGITNQAWSGNTTMHNLSYHHNIIARTEYCFEVWSHSTATSTMSHVLIQNNVCVDSGGGWSHAQRPDPSGDHLHFASTIGVVSNISILNNVFYQSVPYRAGWWLQDPWGLPNVGKEREKSYCASTLNCGWGDSIAEDNNVWFQTDPSLGVLITLGAAWTDHRAFTAQNFRDYRAFTKNGAHSLTADPLLLGLMPTGDSLRPNWTNCTDLHPSPSSPAIGAGQRTIWQSDFAGWPIPTVSPPDIGAFQHHKHDVHKSDDAEAIIGLPSARALLFHWKETVDREHANLYGP
jgi:hypothetical protein